MYRYICSYMCAQGGAAEKEARELHHVLSVCVCMCAYVHVYICMYLCIGINMYIYIYVYMCAGPQRKLERELDHAHDLKLIQNYIQTRIYIHMHTRTRTYTYTHQVPRLSRRARITLSSACTMRAIRTLRYLVCVYVRVRVCICMYIRVCIHVYTYMFMYSSVYMCAGQGRTEMNTAARSCT